jgi:hypothetical protein
MRKKKKKDESGGKRTRSNHIHWQESQVWRRKLTHKARKEKRKETMRM